MQKIRENYENLRSKPILGIKIGQTVEIWSEIIENELFLRIKQIHSIDSIFK